MQNLEQELRMKTLEAESIGIEIQLLKDRARSDSRLMDEIKTDQESLKELYQREKQFLIDRSRVRDPEGKEALTRQEKRQLRTLSKKESKKLKKMRKIKISDARDQKREKKLTEKLKKTESEIEEILSKIPDDSHLKKKYSRVSDKIKNREDQLNKRDEKLKNLEPRDNSYLLDDKNKKTEKPKEKSWWQIIVDWFKSFF